MKQDSVVHCMISIKILDSVLINYQNETISKIGINFAMPNPVG